MTTIFRSWTLADIDIFKVEGHVGGAAPHGLISLGSKVGSDTMEVDDRAVLPFMLSTLARLPRSEAILANEHQAKPSRPCPPQRG